MGFRTSDAMTDVVVFDVVGTLFSLDVVKERFRQEGAPESVFDVWFSQALRDFFSRSLAGSYTPLKDVLESTLQRALARTEPDFSEEQHANILGGLQNLHPAQGAEKACGDLTSAGFHLIALTNGSRQMAEGLLERSKLARHFAAVVSCDEIGVSKPHRQVYDSVVRRHPAEGHWLISVHSWDVAGALDAGWRAAWVSNIEKLYPDSFPRPTLCAPSLDTAAEQILATIR